MIELYSGKFVDPLDLRREDVAVEDIAHALAMQCRYSGHTLWHYSVAQHSVLCSKAIEGGSELKFEALMHDASEAYLQDMARPLKKDPYVGQAYRGAEKRVQRVLADVFDLAWPEPPEVKVIDTRILHDERTALLPRARVGRWSPEIEAMDGLGVRIERWTPVRAEREFLLRYERLRARRELEREGT